MTARDRRLLWGIAWSVAILFLVVAALASNLFLLAGALVYGLLLLAFTWADSRSSGED